VLAAAPVIETVKPVEEVAGNWFFTRIVFKFLLIEYSKSM
jgi:hypothetical protein